MKKYRLTESGLRGMIREAVKGVLNEGFGGGTYSKKGAADELFSNKSILDTCDEFYKAYIWDDDIYDNMWKYDEAISYLEKCQSSAVKQIAAELRQMYDNATQDYSSPEDAAIRDYNDPQNRRNVWDEDIRRFW